MWVIYIRYASIRSIDISNGEGVGIALFVQGCYFHCPNCFNPETWDFSAGKKWTEETKNKFLELANRPYIKRISILGGEPLEEKNIFDVLDLIERIRLSKPQKSIWLYTGYTWESIWNCGIHGTDLYGKPWDAYSIYQLRRQEIVRQCDVLVDGEYIEEQKDITLKWRGSKNQRVIDVQKTLQQGNIILWSD